MDAVHVLSGQEKTFECKFWVILIHMVVWKFHVGKSPSSGVKKSKIFFLCSRISRHCTQGKKMQKILKNNDKHYIFEIHQIFTLSTQNDPHGKNLTFLKINAVNPNFLSMFLTIGVVDYTVVVTVFRHCGTYAKPLFLNTLF